MIQTLNDYGIEPCTIHDVVCSAFTQEQWRRLATKIDNSFIGSEMTFRAERKNGYYYLNTNRCDDAGFIKVFTNGTGIDKITILGEHTDGWQEIHKGTYENVKRSLNGWFN